MVAVAALKKRFARVQWKKLLSSSQFYFFLAFWGLLFALFFVDAFHESYPDEWDNILGGWYILHGRLIYTGFFTHHGPAAYFLSSIVLLFSGHSFVRFRVVYNVLLFAFMGASYLFLRRQLGSEKTKFFPALIATIAVAATYFWSQMLLADNVSAFCLLVVYGLLFLKDFYKKPLTLLDLFVVSTLTSVAILSSLTYLYIIIGVYVYVAYEYLKQYRKEFISLRTLKTVGVLVYPYIVFGLYLLVTRSLSAYMYDAITFNEKYYIYNYPGPRGHFINPIRFAVVIAHTVIDAFATLLIQVKDFNFAFPLNITLVLGDLAVLIYLLFKGYRKLPLFVLFFMIYANARSNPLLSAEHDYQSQVYIFISLFNISFLLPSLYRQLNTQTVELGKKVVFATLFVFVGLYSLFTSIFFINAFSGKYYPKYMGWAPLIYDRPELAPVLNKIVPANEYIWVGPFEFEELFFTQAKPASHVQILNPGGGHSPVISSQLVSDIETTKPKVIWFDENFYILGERPKDYAKTFIQDLDEHYVQLYKYQDGNKKYVSLLPHSERIDLDGKLYIRKEDAKEIINRLLANNLVEEVPAK